MTRHIVIWTAAAVVFSGCTETSPADSILFIEIQPDSRETYVGIDVEFTASATFHNYTIADVTNEAAWQSSDIDVAVVDDGMVTPVSPGQVTITAAYGGHEDASELYVEAVEIESCLVEPEQSTALCGDSENFVVTALYSDGSHEDATSQAVWQVSEPDAATIDDGLVTFHSGAVLDVGASIDGMECESAQVEVICDPCGELVVARATDGEELIVGGSIQLAASCWWGEDSIDTTNHVTWFSSGSTIVEVSNSPASIGVATGLQLGTARVWAEYTNPDDTVDRSNELELTVESAPVTSISVSPAEPVTIAPAGATQHYTATCIYGNGASDDCTTNVTWHSSNESVCVISNAPGTEGLATAVEGGTASITATMDDVVSNIAVFIREYVDYCTEVQVTTPTPNIPPGADAQFTATCIMSDGSAMDVTAHAIWTSDDPAIATIGPGGLAHGVGSGTANITATADLGESGTTVSSEDFLFTVLDVDPERISIQPSSLWLYVGEIAHLSAAAVFGDGSTLDVTTLAAWSSTDETVASVVHTNGEVAGVRAGTATISAHFGGWFDSVDVIVLTDLCESIEITPNPVGAMIGEEIELSANCITAYDVTRDVTDECMWMSDDESVITVDSVAPVRGRVQGIVLGATTVTATYVGSDGGEVVSEADVYVLSGPLESISIEPALPDMLCLGSGETSDFIAWGHDAFGSAVNITNAMMWESSDERIATVSNENETEGRVTAVAAGTVDITATESTIGIFATVTLVVGEGVLISLTIQPGEPDDLPVGYLQRFYALAHDSCGFSIPVTNSVTWDSSNETVATISNDPGTEGIAAGIAPGSTEITAVDGVAGLSSPPVTLVVVP